MKIFLSYRGVNLEAERHPLSNDRFRALCLLAAGGLYVGLTLGIAAICGFAGVLSVAAATVLVMALNA